MFFLILVSSLSFSVAEFTFVMSPLFCALSSHYFFSFSSFIIIFFISQLISFQCFFYICFPLFLYRASSSHYFYSFSVMVSLLYRHFLHNQFFFSGFHIFFWFPFGSSFSVVNPLSEFHVYTFPNCSPHCFLPLVSHYLTFIHFLSGCLLSCLRTRCSLLSSSVHFSCFVLKVAPLLSFSLWLLSVFVFSCFLSFIFSVIVIVILFSSFRSFSSSRFIAVSLTLFS